MEGLYYALKHPRPLNQEPSPVLKRYIDQWVFHDLPVLDIACGYGRNGAYCVSKGATAVFVDHDPDCLDFIRKGVGVSYLGDIDTSKVDVIQADLNLGCWPFSIEQRFSGIIVVHFYSDWLLDHFCTSLAPGGFLYFETIDGRGTNWRGLPSCGRIYSKLSGHMDIVYYKERPVRPFEMNRSACTIFAIKN